MRPQNLFLAVAAAVLATAQPQTVSIYFQPLTLAEIAPSLLAEVSYDASDPGASALISYEAPELPENAKLVRIGAYDQGESGWHTSVMVTSASNFGKGYSPHFVITVDAQGQYLGASVRGVRIDAGQTRDFGPQATVDITVKGKQPELNKPVVLSRRERRSSRRRRLYSKSMNYTCAPVRST